MTETLPAPLVPAEVDLRDFAFTPIYRARLFGSTFNARASDSEWRAGVTLWLKSQDQVPAGTLPDDDVELCRLVELGKDLKAWRKIRAGALHGWFKCSDGRLYNEVTAEVALEGWIDKMLQRKSSGAGNAKRWGAEFDVGSVNEALATAAALLTALNPQSKALRKITTPKKTGTPTGNADGNPDGTSAGNPGGSPIRSQEKGREEKVREGTLGSVAKATGADAPSPPAEGQDLIIVNLTGLRPPAGDWAKLIFGEALDWIAQTLGRDKNKLRSVVGKWRKDLQNDRKLFELIAQAQSTSIAQPLEWLTKAVEQQKAPEKHAGPRPLARPGDETPYQKRVREWIEGGRAGPSPKPDIASARAPL